jgi:F420-dependent oxidoreductase-like protein
MSRISVAVHHFASPNGASGIPGDLAAIARAADDGGLDSLFVCDHLVQTAPGTALDDPILEAYSTLGFLVAQTARIRLGALVSPVAFRAPAVLIRTVTTLDVLSGGRMWLALGTGHHEEEARALGLRLPPVAERYERMEETLQLAERMWSGDQSPLQGTHHRFERPVNVPGPLTRPHPPVVVGGMGERHTLRLVARYADACNLHDADDATLARKLDVLAAHCADAGRPPDAIERTVNVILDARESAASLAERCARMAALGIGHVVVVNPRPWTLAAVEVACEAALRAAGCGAAPAGP